MDTTIDYNDTTVDTDDYQSEVETDHNHNYVDISAFVLDNAPDPSCSNEWKEFLGELDFD